MSTENFHTILESNAYPPESFELFIIVHFSILFFLWKAIPSGFFCDLPDQALACKKNPPSLEIYATTQLYVTSEVT